MNMFIRMSIVCLCMLCLYVCMYAVFPVLTCNPFVCLCIRTYIRTYVRT